MKPIYDCDLLRRKGKGLKFSNYTSCHPIKTQRDAVFHLIRKIKEQAEEDKKYFNLGKAPVGCRGYGKSIGGKRYSENILDEDPIDEWRDSWILEKVTQYFLANRKPRLQSAWHDLDRSVDEILLNAR